MNYNKDNIPEFLKWYIENKTSIQYLLTSKLKQSEEIDIFLSKYPGNTVPERLYNWFHGNSSVKLCDCGNRLVFTNFKTGYSTSCVSKCEFHKARVKEKTRNTCLQRFGVSSPTKAPDVMKKLQQTKQEKYGNPSYNNRTKAAETCIERYGVENPGQLSDHTEKCKITSFENFGVEHYSKTDEFKERTKNTFLKNFGVEHYSKTDEYKEKYRDTCLAMFGVENYSQTDEFPERFRQSCLSKFGVEHYSQTNNASNGYSWKDYTLPSGKVIRIQGYEHFLLDELLSDFTEDEVITDRSQIPDIWYDLNGKRHRYFPDVFIPKTNTIYEVKSEYTFSKDKEVNELKFKAVVDSGFNFILKIY